jgi:hypothetical protein
MLTIKTIPECLKNHILPFNWDVQKVWNLAVPTINCFRTEFDYLLELPLWSSIPGKGMLFDISPIEVIEKPVISPYQSQRLNAARLEYPLDFLIFEGNKWILDGVHRLAKHRLLNNDIIEVRFHNESSISIVIKADRSSILNLNQNDI